MLLMFSGMRGLFFFIFILLARPIETVLAQTTVPSTQPTTTPTTQPEPSDPKLVIAIKRIAYIRDVEVVRLGLKQIERFIKPDIDLSQNEDLLRAFLNVIESTTETGPEIDDPIRREASRFLGEAKLVPLGENDLLRLLGNEKHVPFVETALISFAQKFKAHPPTTLIDGLQKLDRIDTLHAIAVGSADLALMEYLANEALQRKRPELLYSLNNKRIAELAAGHFLTQLSEIDPPMILRVSRASSTKILIEWEDRSLNEEGFIIDRSSNGSTFAEVARAANNQVAIFVDTPETPGPYWFQVRAYFARKSSEPSQNLSIDTSPPTTAPTTQPSTQPVKEEPATQPSTQLGTQPSTQPATFLDESEPAPSPEPEPEPEPVLPPSPASQPKFEDLASRLLIYVEDEPHHPSLLALVTVLAESSSVETATKSAEYLARNFTRPAYDFDGATTSYGLRAVREARRRSRREAENYDLPSAAVRKQYEVRLNDASKKLAATFEDK